MFAAKYDALDFCLAPLCRLAGAGLHQGTVSHMLEITTSTALEATDISKRKKLASTTIDLMGV